MTIVKVIFSHSDTGNCRDYYRTQPNNQLICRQEESKDSAVWYTAIDDGTWEEPAFPIDMNEYDIRIAEAA